MSPELGARLEALIAAQRAGSDAELRALSVRMDGLVVYRSISVLAVAATGDVTVLGDDGVLDIERDSGWCTIAFVHAARLHPELAALLPTRPTNATDCVACDGAGIVKYGDVSFAFDCGVCSALGWVPRSEGG